jgi:hypothetical protein
MEHYAADASQTAIRRLRWAESYLPGVSGAYPASVPGVSGEETVKIAANLDEKDAKALKARLEAQLANMCGGEWRVDVYRARGRWLARAYRKGEHTRGPKPGTKHRQRMKRKLDGP